MSNQALIDLVTEYEALLEQGEAFFLDQEAYRHLIEHYLHDEAYELALEVVERAIDCHSYTAEFLLRKAEILIHAHQERQALVVLTHAVKLAPNETEIRLLRAQALTYLGDHLDAHEQLNYLPEELDASMLAEVYFVRALIYENQQEYDAMFLALKEAAAYDSEMRHCLGKLMSAVQHTRSYEESITLHEQIIDENPYSTVAWQNLGLSHAYLGNYDEALEALEYAYLADESNEQAYRDRADLAFELQRYSLTLEICEEIQQLFGEEGDLLLRMGQCHLRLSHLDAAKSYLKKALQQDSHSDEAYFHLGEAAILEEKWQLAIHYCNKAIEIDDNREEYHATIAAAYAEMGNYELAEDHYRLATDIAPEEASYWQQYALFLLETEQFEAAMDVLELAEESSVGPELSYCRIACLFEVGDRQEALLQLSEVLEEDYDSYFLLFKMAPQLQKDSEIVSLLRAYS
ncbi:tetratricopeptide repeat protein [Haliscomenobacter sp.]|uniref:tetratricopeptide repeat protein n=1 Tax=Haliscomenobacter sp. TaxID=2717303 RepID=UPI003364BF69